MGKWTAALESGEYTQTEGKLYDGESYCCLGVRRKLEGAVFVEAHDKDDLFATEDQEIGNVTSKKVREWGLDKSVSNEETAVLNRLIGNERDEFYEGSQRLAALVTLNDSGYSFDFIANVLSTLGWDNS